jgi:hypothetical protein
VLSDTELEKNMYVVSEAMYVILLFERVTIPSEKEI